MAGKYGVFLTEEEIEWLAALLAKRKGGISYSIFLKLTEVAEKIPPMKGSDAEPTPHLVSQTSRPLCDV